jgi:hypothetical protein
MTAHALCKLTKATNTRAGYVTLIAFQRKQWLHEHLSMLRDSMTAHALSSFLIDSYFM